MNARRLLIGLGKLGLCGLAYFIGLIVGSMVTTALRLPPPPMPDGVSQASAALALLAGCPLLGLGLALVASGLAGNWLARTLMLASLTFVAYTLNNVLDAALYLTAYANASGFTALSALVPSLLCGAAAAALFPPAAPRQGLRAAWRTFFRQRTAGQWLWRLALAGLAFAPVYIFFGLLVNPITGAYYSQGQFGLTAAGWDQILPMQVARSLLFLAACLPIIIAWQKSERGLLLRLGGAVFILVGLIFALIGYWLPWFVRLPHAIEILADSFVYVALLTWLLARPAPSADRQPAARGLQQARSRP